MFSALVSPFVQPSFSPEDVWKLAGAHKPSKHLWEDTQGRPQELSTTTRCHGTGCELQLQTSFASRSWFLTHPRCTEQLWASSSQGCFLRVIRTRPPQLWVPLPIARLPQTQPKLSPLQPAHGPAAGIAVTVLS